MYMYSKPSIGSTDVVMLVERKAFKGQYVCCSGTIDVLLNGSLLKHEAYILLVTHRWRILYMYIHTFTLESAFPDTRIFFRSCIPLVSDW